MTPAQKTWIDNATYEELLRKWRYAPTGDAMFQGETGQYYFEVMQKRKNDPDVDHVATSKRIGWE